MKQARNIFRFSHGRNDPYLLISKTLDAFVFVFWCAVASLTNVCVCVVNK